MENPATWGQAERVVSAAYGSYVAQCEKGVIGLSLARVITDALRRHGLLKEDQ